MGGLNDIHEFSEEEHQARQDVHMMTNMDDLKGDKRRMGRAKKMAKSMAKEADAESKSMKKIAKRKA